MYPRIYLASQSPRRHELLRQIGVSFDVLDVSIDETPVEREAPLAYVRRMAHDKAQGAWEHIMRHELPAAPVLAADTTVVLGDLILGKPFDADDACKMLRSLSGAAACGDECGGRGVCGHTGDCCVANSSFV